MDGHENSSDSSNPSGQAPHGGIFSSGDVPAPAEPVNDQSSNSVVGPRLGGVVPSTRSASSANPTSPVVYTSGRSTSSESTLTGDLVLKDGKKKSKKGWIIGVVIAVLAAIGAIVFFLFLAGPSRSEVAESFKVYYDFMYNGPEEGYSDMDEWFLLELSELNDFDIDRNKYVTELKQKYDKFSNTFAQSRLDRNVKAVIGEVLPEYEQMVSAITAYANLQTITKNLQNEAIQNGSSAANQQISTYLILSNSENNVSQFSNDLAAYFENIINVIELYRNNNCIDEDNNIVFSCATILGRRSSQMIALNNQGAALTNSLTQQFIQISSDFKKDSELINSKLERAE